MKKYFCFLIFTLTPLVHADTIVKKRLNELPKLVQPKKLTVGPDDNYQVDVSKSENLMVFTRKSHLSSRLYLQSPNDDIERQILDDTADANSAVFSPSDNKLAFVYYKTASRGDLCLIDLKATRNNPECFQLKGEIESPQWVNSEQIVYVSKEFTEEKSSLFIININSKKSELIDKGIIWSPAVQPGGEYLAYNKRRNNSSHLVLRKLNQDKVWEIKVDLPGISGFPEFSTDGQWLYFSHYFSDTDADQKIDANDNSVIFRLNLKQVFANTLVVPQQITSGEQNCSFPKLRNNHLFVTCDFEGSLDVYRLPITGVIPPDWNATMLNEAHQSSRNYNQRILLLNHLLYKGFITSGELYSLKLFSDFMLNDDALAAKYYLNNLKITATPSEKLIWNEVDLYLQARVLKKAQKNNEITKEFAKKLNFFIEKFKKSKTSTAKFAELLLYTFLNNYNLAFMGVKRIQGLSYSGINQYLYAALTQTLVNNKNLSIQDVFNLYRPLLLADRISKESRLYYAYNYLSSLQEKFTNQERRMVLREQVTLLKKYSYLESLFEAEIIAIRIILEKNDKLKDKIYPELDKLMSLTRDDYFLRKALYIRAIDNFVEENQVKYLTYVATTWLKYTQKSETEFIYAREVYVDKVLSRAYKNIGDGQHYYAANNFYGSLSLTDDLESHYSYILSMKNSGKSDLLKKQYDNLVKREFLDENIHYVNSIIELTSLNAEKDLSTQSQLYNKILENLLKMKESYSSPVYQLLLGYVYLKQTELSINRFSFNQELAKLSHKHLMLAYDLGRDNLRIKASALSDLAYLHYHTRNWGLSRRFFELREPLGFVNNEQEFAHYWFYSRVSFYQSDYVGAIELCKKLLNIKVPNKNYEAEILQSLALYQLAQGDYINSEINYDIYLKKFPKESLWNRSKSELGLGFSRFKLLKERSKNHSETTLLAKALENFNNVIESSKKLTFIKSGNNIKMDQSPQRLIYLAQGYKAQLLEGGAAVEAKLKFLNILNELEPNLSSLAMDNKKWQAQKIKTELQLSSLLLKSKNTANSISHLDQAFSYLKSYIEKYGYSYNTDLVEALVSWAGLAVSLKSNKHAMQVNDYFTATIEEMAKMKSEATALLFQSLRLKSFQWLIQDHLLNQKSDIQRKSLEEQLGKIQDLPWKEKAQKIIKIFSVSF
ncbi:MAG: hypothetical protein H6625_01940 [Bdellovibrionaceae bacterium]|nr:hypothetical protein [Pseudobdellovibrionaceae bacterium]